MNITTNNISLPSANLSTTAKNVVGIGRGSANLNTNIKVSTQPAIPVQINISGRAVDNSIIENPTYEKPTNKHTKEISSTSINTTKNVQQGENPDSQDDEDKITQADSKTEQEKTDIPPTNNQEQFTEAELKELSSLKMRDSEVEIHERAHSAVGGQYAGSPSYTYQTGPDGVKYAVGGEVSIDTSPIPNDPQATLQKAQQIKAAALAPAEPSQQDRRVAAKADQMAAQARNDILQANYGSHDTKGTTSTTRNQSSIPDHFTQVQSLEKETNEQEKLHNRIQQIHNIYENSSMTRSSSTFHTQI